MNEMWCAWVFAVHISGQSEQHVMHVYTTYCMYLLHVSILFVCRFNSLFYFIEKNKLGIKLFYSFYIVFLNCMKNSNKFLD